MKRILAILVTLLLCHAAHAQRLVTHGTTDESEYVMIVDSSDNSPETGVTAATAGLDLEYVREGAAAVDLTESNLASAIAAHTDGGIFHVGHGLYRVDLPDAAYDSGASHVKVIGTATGMFVLPVTVQLTAFDLQDSTPSVDATQVSGSATTADRLESAYEGATYVRWTSDATTSGTALRAAVEGASAGTVIRVSRGDYDIGATSLTFPTMVSLVGDDREGVIIRGSLASGPTFIPGLLTTIEGATLRNTSTGDVLGKASGSLSNGALRNARILGGATGVKFNSASACLFTLENVIIRPDTAGIAISGAAHEIRIKDVSVLLQSGSATVGADFQDTCNIRGDHFYINMPSALTGIGMRVGDTAQVNLHNTGIHALGASINIEDATAFPTLIRGEFNRSLVTGEIANLEDLSSPLRPTVHGRELAVTAGGRTGINWGDVENPTTAQTLSQTVIKDATDVVAGTSQPRINRKPDPAFTVKVSRRSDGTHKATTPIRITPGAIDQVYAWIDMSPLFGPDNYVETVGTPIVEAGGSITASAEGPRDTYAVVELDGTATASEERTITVPVTMDTGTTVNVLFDVEVFAE